ncbi:MAG: hypothetical protein WEB37_11670 [Bacteroidota bacterium]
MIPAYGSYVVKGGILNFGKGFDVIEVSLLVARYWLIVNITSH